MFHHMIWNVTAVWTTGPIDLLKLIHKENEQYIYPYVEIVLTIFPIVLKQRLLVAKEFSVHLK